MTLHRATGCLPALAHCVAALFEGYAGLDKRWGVRISSTTCVGLPNGDDPPGSILSGNPRHTTYCKSPTAAKSNSPTRCGPRRIRKWTETTTRGVQLPDQQTPPSVLASKPQLLQPRAESTLEEAGLRVPWREHHKRGAQ